MSAQNIKLNMIPSGIVPVFYISQYDKGRELSASVYFGVLPFNLDNYTVTIEATRNDGVAIVTAVETSNNNGTFEVTPTMSNVVGKYYAQLVIVNSNSKRIASLPFAINVIKAAMDENAEAIEEDATLYQQYTDAMQGAIAEVKADLVDETTARQNDISQVNTALTNEANARANADDTLRTRIDNIIAGETPSAEEVADARVSFDGEVYSSLGNAVRSQIAEVIDAISGNANYNVIQFNEGYIIYTDGETVDISTTVQSSSMGHVVIDVTEGDQFILNGTGAGHARLWCFIDSNGNSISKSDVNIVANDYVIGTPPNASKLIINRANNREHKNCYKGDMLYNLVQKNTDFIEDETGNSIIKFVSRFYIKTNGSTVDITQPTFSNNFEHAIVDTTEGERFVINGTGQTTPRLWCFIDTDGNSLCCSSDGKVGENLLITAPANASKLIINRLRNIPRKNCYRGDLFVNTMKENVDCVEDVTGNSVIKFIQGARIITNENTVDTTAILFSDAGVECAVIDAIEGEQFTLNGTGASQSRLWCFIDSNGNSLSKAVENKVADNLLITAPSNSAKLVINRYNDRERKNCYRGDLLVRKLEPLMGYNGQLSASDDLNNLHKMGVYYISNSNIPLNCPVNNSARLLVVKSLTATNHNEEWQLFATEANGMYYRVRGTSTWSNWKSLATKEDINKNLDDAVVKNYNPIAPYSYSQTVPTLIEAQTEGGYDNLLDTVYGLWDGLMEQYPQFISKEQLTLSDDILIALPSVDDYEENETVLIVDGNDEYTQYRKINGEWVNLYTWRGEQNIVEYNKVKMTCPVYAYTIAPYKNCTLPKIVWVSGLHGQESNSHISTFYLFKELLEKNLLAPSLSSILSRHVFVVIPAAGASATKTTYGVHGMSENYINPNRDFPEDWAEQQDIYSRTGNVPCYDPYTRMLMEYIEGLDNVLYLVNKHDSESITDGRIIAYTVDRYDTSFAIEKKVFDQLDMMMKIEYPWLFTGFTGTSWNPNSKKLFKNNRVSVSSGTFDKWTSSIGIHSALLEVAGSIGNDFETGHADQIPKIHCEVDINLLNAIASNSDYITYNDNAKV